MVKRQLYSRYGVEEYWIVDPENREVEIYRQLEQSLAKVATVRDHQILKSSILPGLELDVKTLFDR